MAKKKRKKFNVIAKKADLGRIKYTILPGKVQFYDVYPYFSFRYYHISHNRFTHNGFTNQDFRAFFKRIHEVSQHKWGEIFGSLKSFFRAHEVDWSKTTQKRGFAHLGRVLQDCPVYQFEIFKECRIFGFFNQDNVFKIVWIDRHHQIYYRS